MYFCVHITAQVHNDYVAVACSNNNQARRTKKSCMTASISLTNCQRVHWLCWKILLKDSAKYPAWLGPYTISRNLGKGVYKLKNTGGNVV